MGAAKRTDRAVKGPKADWPVMLIHPCTSSGKKGIAGERGPKKGYTVADLSQGDDGKGTGDIDDCQLVFAAAVCASPDGSEVWARGGSHIGTHLWFRIDDK